ncbi:MAG: hypothetical protein ACLFMZ_08565 [Spirochaetaceae bacterium]
MKKETAHHEKVITDFIWELKGVIGLEKLEAEQVAAVKDRCLTREQNGFADIVYSGLEAILCREDVWILLKDASFRPPPAKTVYMVEDVEESEPQGESVPQEVGEKEEGEPEPEHILTIGDRRYHIIGEEIFKGEPEPEEPHFFLGEGFVLFTERRKGTEHLPAYFLLPPISFPELEERKEDFGIRNIVSFSPPGTTDKILRDMFGFDHSPDYATVLIGMDRIDDHR